MLKHALVLVAIVAVLPTGTLPAADACATFAVPDHACCAEPAPEPTSSCCTKMEASGTPAETGHENGCDCIHPLSAPVAVTVSMAPSAPEDSAPVDPMTKDRLFDHTSLSTARAIDHRVGTHPPPPVFLLDCCFLI